MKNLEAIDNELALLGKSNSEIEAILRRATKSPKERSDSDTQPPEAPFQEDLRKTIEKARESLRVKGKRSRIDSIVVSLNDLDDNGSQEEGSEESTTVSGLPVSLAKLVKDYTNM